MRLRLTCGLWITAWLWVDVDSCVLFCYSRNRRPAGDSKERAATAEVRFLTREDEARLKILDKLCQFFCWNQCVRWSARPAVGFKIELN